MRTPMSAVLMLLLASWGVPVKAQVLRQLTFTPKERVYGFAMDDAGRQVVAITTETGPTNPRSEPRLVTWDLAAGSRDEVFPFRVCCSVSLSDDGRWAAFISDADPLGTNSDGSDEVFLGSTNGQSIRQLTDRPVGSPPIPQVVLSGSVEQVLFIDSANLLGSNVQRLPQLFRIGVAGGRWAQLTSNDDPAARFGAGDLSAITSIAISDDGQRIVFSHSGNLTGENPFGTYQLFRVDPSGQNLTQWTPGTNPRLAGGGSRVAFDWNGQVQVVDWGVSTPKALVTGVVGSITDDGVWIYYSTHPLGSLARDQAYRIAAEGGAAQLLSFASHGRIPDSGRPAVSGAGSRMAFLFGEDAYYEASREDNPIDLFSIDPSSLAAEQLTQITPVWMHWEPDISRDGSQALYARGVDYAYFDLFRSPTAGGPAQRLTVGLWTSNPALSGDGRTAAFASGALGNGLWILRDDGSAPYSVYPFRALYPVIGKASDEVVFQGQDAELHRVALEGGPDFRITDDGDGLRKNPRVDYAGEWIAYHSQADPFGTNPGTAVFRIRSDGASWQQITAGGSALLPDISGDGSLVVYESNADPLGRNPDRNQEIFLWSAATGATEQLTDTSSGSCWEPRISGNGRYVFYSFFSSYTLDGLYRADLATGRLERVSGPRGGNVLSGTLRNNPGVAVDESGERVVFVGDFDAGMNPDYSNEVFFADFTALPAFVVSPSTPTVLSWEPDPRAVAYDVIRGDLCNLSTSGNGGTSLGPVACLAQGLTEPTTASAPDAETPGPDQGFFYLYRFTQEPPAGPGSWGQATDGSERIPSEGDCSAPD